MWTGRSDDPCGSIIENSLAFVRGHLDMEVAYLSEFVCDDLVFRAVDAPGFEDRIAVGGSMPLDQVYCRHVISGRLPELIPDTNDEPFTQQIPLTKSLPIRSHVSVPIRKSDGSVYGMFCCLSREPRPSLNNRDLGVLRAFANISAEQVNSRLVRQMDYDAKRREIEKVNEENAFRIALQPIKSLDTQQLRGYEALCRFTAEPHRPPNQWFEQAARVGMQLPLELKAIEKAFGLLPDIPGNTYLSVNASPLTLISRDLLNLIPREYGHRIKVEVTEHNELGDLDAVLMQIDRLRDLGVRIAVDDAGAGYSGLQQIIKIKPDMIKLDISLTQGVDRDIARRSLVAAMVQFSRDTGANLVAEGIETKAEMDTLCQIGVSLGQGYYLGRPAMSDRVLLLPKSA